MKARLLGLLLACVAGTLFLGWGITAEPSKIDEKNLGQFKDETALAEQHMSRQFGELLQMVLKLRDRLKRSNNQEDRDRAVLLDKVLESAKDRGISTQFESLVDLLSRKEFKNVADIKVLAEKSKVLADDLKELVNLLKMDSQTNRSREKAEKLKDIIKKIEAAIIAQKQVQAQTDIGKTEKKELEGNQRNATEQTAKIGKDIANLDGPAKDQKDLKGEQKAGGKDGGKKSEAKDAGDQDNAKKGEGKDGQGQEKDQKPGQAKAGDPKGGDPKEGDPKEGDPKAGDPKTATAKAGDPKGGDPKQGEPKAGGDPKGGDPKAGDPKSGAQAKAGDPKGGDPKGGDPKGGDPKGGDPKAGGKEGPKDGGEKTAAKDNGEKNSLKTKSKDEPQAQAKDQGKGGEKGPKTASAKESKESKAGDSKSGGEPKQAEAKEGKQSQGQGQAKDSGAQPPPQQAGGKDSPPPPPGGNNQPKDDNQIAKKQVEDANYKQQQAEENIRKNDNDKASGNQGKAIKDLEQAKKKLEELLRQMREEELERLLAALQARCERMLAMQIAVFNGTVNVDGAIQANADKKADRTNQLESLKLSDQEKDIVSEATKAIEMLEAEGTAVAFPEVFQQVREDMKHVQRRLDVTDVGKVTQAIETDIIDTLKEMIEALKKAKKELDEKKNPPPPGEGKQGPPPDQKLLDQIAELKMIRSMQIRVNNRTQTYGKMYQGEQANEPNLRREVIQLSERQEKIYDVTNRIAKGDNK